MHKQNAKNRFIRTISVAFIILLSSVSSSALSQESVGVHTDGGRTTSSALAETSGGSLRKVIFWARSDVGVMKVYVSGQYIGSITGYADSAPDCQNPTAAFPTALLPPGQYSFQAIGVEGYERRLIIDGDFVLDENPCLLFEIVPPPETYEYMDGDYTLLEIILGTALGFVLLWAAGVF